MEILALDIATKTGWRNSTSSGVWDLRIKKDESDGMRVLRFKSKLQEIINLQKPGLVVFERPAGRHKKPIMVQSEMHGVLKLLCLEHEIQYRAYSAGEIKSHATGKGNCGKPAMIKAAKLRWPEVEFIDDNHVDAYWLYNLAYNEYGLL